VYSVKKKFVIRLERILTMVYRAVGLVLDSIHRLACGRQKIPHTRRWIKSKTSPIALYKKFVSHWVAYVALLVLSCTY
jgi:hypothetical protein